MTDSYYDDSDDTDNIDISNDNNELLLENVFNENNFVYFLNNDGSWQKLECKSEENAKNIVQNVKAE